MEQNEIIRIDSQASEKGILMVPKSLPNELGITPEQFAEQFEQLEKDGKITVKNGESFDGDPELLKKQLELMDEVK